MQICIRNVITNNNEIEEVFLQSHLMYNSYHYKEAPLVKQTHNEGIYINFVVSQGRK